MKNLAKLMLFASLVLAACFVYFAFAHGAAMRSDNPDFYRLLVPLPLAAIVFVLVFYFLSVKGRLKLNGGEYVENKDSRNFSLTDEEAYELFHAVNFTIKKTESSFPIKSAGAEKAVAARANHTIAILKSLADRLQKDFKHLHF